MKKLLAALSLATLFAVAPATAAVITPAVEYTSTNTLTEGAPYTLGYSFTLSSAVTVNALGYWNDGLGNNHAVGIWDSSNTLVATTTVLGTDPVVGHFLWGSIADTLLAAGQYTIGAEFLANNGSTTFPSGATGLTTISEYSWITDEQIFGAGLNLPTTTTNGGYGANGILLANFSVTATTSVPEPISITLFGAGLVGVGALRRRRKVNA